VGGFQYLPVDKTSFSEYTYKHKRRKDFIYICGSMSSLEMEQVCLVEKTVTVEAVKLAWEQAKEKVEIWEGNIAKRTQDEERAEGEIPIVAEEENVDCVVCIDCNCRKLPCTFLLFTLCGMLTVSIIIMNVVFAVEEMYVYVLNQSSDSPTIIRTLLIIRLIVMVTNAVVSLLACFSLSDNLCSLPNKLIPGTWLPSISLLLLAILAYASSLIIAIILRSYGYDYDYEGSIFYSVVGLAPYGLTLMITIWSYSKHLARSRAEEMVNAIQRAATVTRDWAATKSADLQKLLTTNDTPQVDLKTVLAASPKIETVIQICEKAQTMCQAAVNGQNPSLAAKQATEILQAIPTMEGLLLEVEEILPQLPSLPDIQVE
jgi:hypothetical protein